MPLVWVTHLCSRQVSRSLLSRTLKLRKKHWLILTHSCISKWCNAILCLGTCCRWIWLLKAVSYISIKDVFNFGEHLSGLVSCEVKAYICNKKFSSVVSSARKLFRASSFKARVDDKCSSVSARHCCSFLSAQGLSYQVCILKYQNSEAVTLNATASICCADQVDQCTCAVLVASWLSCRLLTARLLPSQWSMMQSCRKKKNQQTKLVRLFSCACVCICVCAYGLVDAVSMSPFSIGVYGNSLLLLLLFLFILPLIGRDVFTKCISQQRVHSFGVIY